MTPGLAKTRRKIRISSRERGDLKGRRSGLGRRCFSGLSVWKGSRSPAILPASNFLFGDSGFPFFHRCHGPVVIWRCWSPNITRTVIASPSYATRRSSRYSKRPTHFADQSDSNTSWSRVRLTPVAEPASKIATIRNPGCCVKRSLRQQQLIAPLSQNNMQTRTFPTRFGAHEWLP